MDECENPEQVTTMLKSHVETLLRQIWEQSEIIADDDGDYAFRTATAIAWVRVIGGEQPAIRVFAHAACDVPGTKKTLQEVTELNACSRWAKISWSDGCVVVDQAIHWLSVDRGSLERALESVTVVSDDIGVMIATIYGGHTPFPYDTKAEGSDRDAA